MKSIQIDEDLYAYIASQTKDIGESASHILRRLLLGDANAEVVIPESDNEVHAAPIEHTEEAVPAVEGDDLFARLAVAERSPATSRVEWFLTILATMHQIHGENFADVLKVKGRNRLYFATAKDTLLEAGSSTNPKQIPNSEFWVVTNNNTGKKQSMLKEVAEVLGYSSDEAQKLLEVFAS